MEISLQHLFLFVSFKDHIGVRWFTNVAPSYHINSVQQDVNWSEGTGQRKGLGTTNHGFGH